jgi:hypothetical protein
MEAIFDIVVKKLFSGSRHEQDKVSMPVSGVLHGNLLPHMLPISVHRTLVNAFTDLKRNLSPGLEFEFEAWPC